MPGHFSQILDGFTGYPNKRAKQNQESRPLDPEPEMPPRESRRNPMSNLGFDVAVGLVREEFPGGTSDMFDAMQELC